MHCSQKNTPLILNGCRNVCAGALKATFSDITTVGKSDGFICNSDFVRELFTL